MSITAPTNVVVLVPLVSSAGSAWLLNAFVCACGVRQFKQVLHIDEGFQVGILYLCRTPKLLKLLRRLRQVSLVRAAPGLISVEHLDTTGTEERMVGGSAAITSQRTETISLVALAP